MSTSEVKVRTETHRAGLDDAHRRHGGTSLVAALAGALTATGIIVLVYGVWSANRPMAYIWHAAHSAPTSLSSVIAGLVLLGVAFLAGGWAAGRTARYDGARNGALAAVVFVALAGVSALLGIIFNERYNVFPHVHLPQWWSRDIRSSDAVLTTAVGVAAVLVAGIVGGKLGDRYHARVDRMIAGTADGGLPEEAGVVRSAPVTPVTDLTETRSVIAPDDLARQPGADDTAVVRSETAR